ncbi:hypothetical protein Tco_0478819 [Tanacetum coccineum]
MTGPITKEHISATSKSFISNDTNGKMIEKNFIEIEGTFLLKIHDNTFHENEGEDVFKHINSFLEVVELLKIRGVSHGRFRLSVFPTSLSGAAKEWFTNECIGTISTWDDLVEIFFLKFYNLCEHEEHEETNDLDVINNVPKNFKINGAKTYDEYAQELNNKTQGNEEPWSEIRVQHQLCDHICEPYRFKNGKAMWPTCNSDIDGFCNGGELPGMVRVGTMTYFQDHSWYNELVDGKLKDETLAFKAKIEGSWGDATQGLLKLCRWLKIHFENFHELEYENNPHLGTNHISEGNHEANNVGCDQENQEHMNDSNPDPSNCKIRRFKMMKYSFNDNEEYITIKVSEHLNHSKKILDAYRELL